MSDVDSLSEIFSGTKHPLPIFAGKGNPTCKFQFLTRPNPTRWYTRYPCGAQASLLPVLDPGT